MPVAVILGFGNAVGAGILKSFVDAGFSVAIAARTLSKLEAVAGMSLCVPAVPEVLQDFFSNFLRAAEYAAVGATVRGFSIDLSAPETVAGVLGDIAAALGPIDVVVYNATTPRLDPSASLAELQAAVNVNITSVHVAFYTMLPLWKAAGKGTFLLTGGGFANNCAWSAAWGMQFGSPTKA